LRSPIKDMKAFEVVRAASARQAATLLAEHGSAAKVLAGGTDLLVDLKTAAEVPATIIDISRAEDLRGIAVTDAGLRIGALVTHTEIMRSAVIRTTFPALADAAASVGAVQTRNLGTLGGNLVTCVPSMDSGPTLLVLDADVTVASRRGTRQMTLMELFVGPRETSLGPDELLVEIVIPKANLGKPAAFQKFGLRRGQALALVNAAAAFWVDGDAFASPRIALGAVAPRVMRARETEAFLDGRAITAAAMAEAGRIAACEAEPISDFRASAGYRRDLIEVLTRRALEHAYGRALEGAKERSN
jgi:CO/xanthine dehydrogenase FAD-binding subunit